ncbi:hypothetical protein EON66_05390 [archaeon]|nr:MAG: hypothetical protein EON66_05390 [archaeon]
MLRPSTAFAGGAARVASSSATETSTNFGGQLCVPPRRARLCHELLLPARRGRVQFVAHWQCKQNTFIRYVLDAS